MSICPQCGSDYRESKMCPKLDGKPICMRCCRECSYYGETSDWAICNYHSVYAKPNYGDEIRKLSSKIRNKEGIMRYLYKTNRPRAARIIENEINLLKHEAKELKELQ